MGNVSDQTVEIWVNRPRQYVELLQNMADQNFTPETGIEVKFSLMPNDTNNDSTSPDGGDEQVTLIFF